jgi:hypothetical protein
MRKPIPIQLPTTEKEFTSLVKKLCKKYNFKNEEHATAIVAQRIQHMLPDQWTTSLEYLAGCIIKNMSYQVAVHQAQMIQHKFQIEQIEALLKSNPNDQQALDALETAAKGGSELAKETLAKYRPDAQIIPIVQPGSIGA